MDGVVSRRGCHGLALGTAQWGMPYGVANSTGRPPLDEVEAMLDVARRAGIDTLDTARSYGESEEVIGALTEGDDHWTVVTKLDAAVVAPELTVADSLHLAEESVARSLKALRRSRLDVLLLHRAAHRTAWDGAIWELLQRKRRAGEIGALGVSAGSPEEASALLDDPTVEALQVAASLLDQRLARSGFFRAARQLGKRIFVRSVFLQGVAHFGPDALPGHLAGLAEPLRSVEEWVQSRGLRSGDAFLLYARDLTDGFALIGCETTGQLCHNLIAWRSLEVPPEELGNLAAQIADLDPRLLDPSRWRELSARGRSLTF
jgi:spore coat polysaccharide biosynthesis protein SpsF